MVPALNLLFFNKKLYGKHLQTPGPDPAQIPPDPVPGDPVAGDPDDPGLRSATRSRTTQGASRLAASRRLHGSVPPPKFR